jgi:phytol kinase
MGKVTEEAAVEDVVLTETARSRSDGHVRVEEGTTGETRDGGHAQAMEEGAIAAQNGHEEGAIAQNGQGESANAGLPDAEASHEDEKSRAPPADAGTVLPGTVDMTEDQTVPLRALYFLPIALLAVGGTCGMVAALWTELETIFWISAAIRLALWWGLAALLGAVVRAKRGEYKRIVNYTRKVNHFGLFLIPLMLDTLLPYELSSGTALVQTALVAVHFLPYSAMIRRRVPFFFMGFMSYDRPEDRPNTMLWLVTQMVSGWFVITGVVVGLQHFDKADLIMIPAIVNVFGDGLAEPVGVTWGKHKYRTRALCSSKAYVRSYEGSACVFVSGIVAVALHANVLSTLQLIVSFATVPILMTLAEALSPHTFDTPFLFAVGGGLMLCILCI